MSNGSNTVKIGGIGKGRRVAFPVGACRCVCRSFEDLAAWK